MPTDHTPATAARAWARAAARWAHARAALTAGVMCAAGVVIVLAATTLGISPLGGVLGPATTEPPAEQARGALDVDEPVIDRAPPVDVTEPGPEPTTELAASPVAPVAAAALPTGDRAPSSGAEPPADQSPDEGAGGAEDAAGAGAASALTDEVLEPIAEQVVEPVVESVVEPLVEQVIEPAAEQVVQPLVQATLGLLDPVLSTLTGATSQVGGLLGG